MEVLVPSAAATVTRDPRLEARYFEKRKSEIDVFRSLQAYLPMEEHPSSNTVQDDDRGRRLEACRSHIVTAQRG
jgi:hypothetical protein